MFSKDHFNSTQDKKSLKNRTFGCHLLHNNSQRTNCLPLLYLSDLNNVKMHDFTQVYRSKGQKKREHTTRSGIKRRQRPKSGAGIAMSACSKKELASITI